MFSFPFFFFVFIPFQAMSERQSLKRERSRQMSNLIQNDNPPDTDETVEKINDFLDNTTVGRKVLQKRKNKKKTKEIISLFCCFIFF
jgi:hypothetical protein